MAIRQITKEGDPALRKKCRPVTEFNERLGVLIDDMWDTMYKADGVGLAAPQVSVLRRIAVVDVEDGNKYELINPVIVESEGSQVGAGRLSFDSRLQLQREKTLPRQGDGVRPLRQRTNVRRAGLPGGRVLSRNRPS